MYMYTYNCSCIKLLRNKSDASSNSKVTLKLPEYLVFVHIVSDFVLFFID